MNFEIKIKDIKDGTILYAVQNLVNIFFEIKDTFSVGDDGEWDFVMNAVISDFSRSELEKLYDIKHYKGEILIDKLLNEFGKFNSLLKDCSPTQKLEANFIINFSFIEESLVDYKKYYIPKSDKITPLVLEIENYILRIEKGVIESSDAQDFFNKILKEVKAILEHTDEGLLLSRWETEKGYNYSLVYKPSSYADKDVLPKIRELKEKLIEILYSFSIVLPNKNEYNFAPNQSFEAKKFLMEIFHLAQKDICIVDEYLDEKVFNYIQEINSAVNIRIITGDGKTIFNELFSDFKKMHSNIEAKVNKISHNRYILIDQSILFSTDASVNTIGKKDFMIHKVLEKKEEMIEKITTWWNEGVQITNESVK